MAVATVTNYPIVEAGDPPDMRAQGDEDGEALPESLPGEIQDLNKEFTPEDIEKIQDSLKESNIDHGSSGTLRVNGNFNDWRGMPNLGDRQHDSSANADLKAVYYGTNEREPNLYFMIQRYRPSNMASSVSYRMYIDINDNGVYNDSLDKYATVSYMPIKKNRGLVIVALYRSGGMLINIYAGFWGEGSSVSERCEFKIPMDNLGITVHQPIRFYVASIGFPADRLPDSGDIQWAPVPASGKLGLALLLVFGLFIIIRSVKMREKC